jgi:hypothetical protein
MPLNTAVMIMIYKRKNDLGFAEAKFLFRKWLIILWLWASTCLVATRPGKLTDIKY